MVFPFKECGACRTCEIACSYKHTGEFNHKVSSLEVLENKDDQGFSIKILEKPEGERYACDGCVGEKMPACMVYCHKKDELRVILDKFLELKDKGG